MMRLTRTAHAPNVVDAARLAFIALRDETGWPAVGLRLHPADVAALTTARLQGEYPSFNRDDPGPLRLWGLPVIADEAVPPGAVTAEGAEFDAGDAAVNSILCAAGYAVPLPGPGPASPIPQHRTVNAPGGRPAHA